MDEDPRPLMTHLPAQQVASSVFHPTRATIYLFSMNTRRPAPQPH